MPTYVPKNTKVRAERRKKAFDSFLVISLRVVIKLLA